MAWLASQPSRNWPGHGGAWAQRRGELTRGGVLYQVHLVLDRSSGSDHVSPSVRSGRRVGQVVTNSEPAMRRLVRPDLGLDDWLASGRVA